SQPRTSCGGNAAISSESIDPRSVCCSLLGSIDPHPMAGVDSMTLHPSTRDFEDIFSRSRALDRITVLVGPGCRRASYRVDPAVGPDEDDVERVVHLSDRKSTRLNSSHVSISYAVFCLKNKK